MSLDDDLIAAHLRGDEQALVDLYERAAHLTQDVDSACFFATQAYIFALDCAHPKTMALHQFLCQHGREE